LQHRPGGLIRRQAAGRARVLGGEDQPPVDDAGDDLGTAGVGLVVDLGGDGAEAVGRLDRDLNAIQGKCAGQAQRLVGRRLRV
jgi:hypothetical protein